VSISSIIFETYEKSVPEILDSIDAASTLRNQKKVLIKPNLINISQPPITTSVSCCRAIALYVQKHSSAEVIIAEGCGEPDYETDHVFDTLGYADLALELDVQLVDLNFCETTLLKNESCTVFPEFYMPKIALDSFIISVPVLKAHSLAQITGSMKNMMGFVVPEHYQKGGHWKKAAFHARMQESILDLNRYRTPDLTLMDATVGMAEYHLGGAHCNPPVNKLIAGYDSQEVDRIAADLLDFDWHEIGHLAHEI